MTTRAHVTARYERVEKVYADNRPYSIERIALRSDGRVLRQHTYMEPTRHSTTWTTIQLRPEAAADPGRWLTQHGFSKVE